MSQELERKEDFGEHRERLERNNNEDRDSFDDWPDVDFMPSENYFLPYNRNPVLSEDFTPDESSRFVT